jgi:hypothetical protein
MRYESEVLAVVIGGSCCEGVQHGLPDMSAIVVDERNVGQFTAPERATEVACRDNPRNPTTYNDNPVRRFCSNRGHCARTVRRHYSDRSQCPLRRLRFEDRPNSGALSTFLLRQKNQYDDYSTSFFAAEVFLFRQLG